MLALRGSAVERSESARAAQLIRDAFPSPIAHYVAIVVHGPVGYTNPRFVTVLDSISAVLTRQPYINQVSVRTIGESTFVSADRRTTFLIAALTASSITDISRTVVPDLREAVSGMLGQLPRADGFDVKVTGNPALDYDVRTISTADTRNAERRALPLTLVVLVLAFGALVAATLPIIVGILAMTIALGVVAVAAQFQPMSVFVLNITTMVGLGVGIDYSLLIVTRFREELNRGLAPLDAAVRTIQTAGSAVVTSGLTVVVGFGALILTPLTETRPSASVSSSSRSRSPWRRHFVRSPFWAQYRPAPMTRMLAFIHRAVRLGTVGPFVGHHPGAIRAAPRPFWRLSTDQDRPANWFPPDAESGQDSKHS
jgi:RND superfamily putative drug exporter